MEKDTWLLKGIVPTPLFIIVRFFHNSLNLFRMQAYDLSESKIPVVQPDEVYGLTSVELVLRHNQKAQGTAPQSQRVLKDVDMQGMDTKKSAHASKTFDRSQSNKRGVRRGSDPIHNRS
ncbi:hypothetical protein NC651_019144 [Populus alba x Populus x berolinensis]|uniref:Uncharacterized protein n=1 Tax=Populus alba x Populus x berolinensis TaxID=444605 RepID=A0AAD6MNG1_9ROSI|nr:hypothetical protein NC651_019144 [Populus alba x Populus x berolinensis]KAJ6987527.1 hypothetical protein NC653_020703 [Populus alba x Populus x berolinensis]